MVSDQRRFVLTFAIAQDRTVMASFPGRNLRATGSSVDDPAAPAGAGAALSLRLDRPALGAAEDPFAHHPRSTPRMLLLHIELRLSHS